MINHTTFLNKNTSFQKDQEIKEITPQKEVETEEEIITEEDSITIELKEDLITTGHQEEKIKEEEITEITEIKQTSYLEVSEIDNNFKMDNGIAKEQNVVRIYDDAPSISLEQKVITEPEEGLSGLFINKKTTKTNLKIKV